MPSIDDLLGCLTMVHSIDGMHPTERSGLDPSNRPQTIKAGLWGRQGLHQSLLDEKNHKAVIPEGVSLSGTSCRKVLGGPRSALRFGGDDIGCFNRDR